MDFKVTRIPYIGRDKYPSNGNSTSVKGIVQNYFGGGGAAIAGGSSVNPNGNYDNDRGKNASSFFCYLSQTNNIFDKSLLPSEDIAYVYGFKDTDEAQVLVGDISTSAASATYGITGIPSGMTIAVSGNGTTDASIHFMVNDAIEVGEGILTIPVAININQSSIDPNHYTFWFYRQNCMTMNLTYHWSVVDSSKQKGPAIRGPYDYYANSGETRDWCNGATSSTISDSDKWIDVVQKDGVYYYCSTAYNGTPLGSNIGNWTSGQSFDFIASNLIMASAASINFLTGNELFLIDSNGDITGGAMGGDGINFWAGDSQPSSAPFRVANDGSLHASRGVFGGTVSAATIYASDIVLDGNALKLFSSSANTFEISDAEIEVEEVPEDVTIQQASYNYSSFDNTTSGGCAALFTAMGDSTTIIPPHNIQAIGNKALDYHQSIVGTVELVCAVFSADSQNTYAYSFLNQQNMPYPDLSRAISSGSNMENFSMTADETYKDVTINASFDEAGGTTSELHLPCRDGVDYVVVFAWIQNGFQTQYLQQFTINFPKYSFVNAPNPTDTQFFNIGSNGMQIFLGQGFYFTAALDRQQGPIISMGGQNMSGQMFGLRLTRTNGIQILTGDGRGWHTPQ